MIFTGFQFKKTHLRTSNKTTQMKDKKVSRLLFSLDILDFLHAKPQEWTNQHGKSFCVTSTTTSSCLSCVK